MMNNNSTTASEKGKSIPSINGLPFFGKMFDFRRDPVGTLYAGWKEAGDIYNIKVGPRTITVISHPLLAQEILIEKKNIFQRPRMYKGGTILGYLLGESVLTTDGELWLSKRRMMQPIFHRQRIQAMGEKMQSAGCDMLSRWSTKPSGETINLSLEMKLVTLDIINRTMFSSNVLPEADRIGDSVDIGLHYITKKSRELLPVPENWPTPANRRFRESRSRLDGYLYKIIQDRRKSEDHPGDLLDMLIGARDESTGEAMNDEQVRNEVATIYGAGHETTAIALTWAWYGLNQTPEVLKKLQEEVDTVLHGRIATIADLPSLPYTLAVLEETLRFYPPVPMTLRVSYSDVEVGGYPFPTGTPTAISINNIHRHPSYWQDPETFKPERFLPENEAKLNRRAYIPFLTGPHQCIGNTFALQEGHLLLAMMAQQYELKGLPNQEIIKEVAITMRPKGGYKVRLVRR